MHGQAGDVALAPHLVPPAGVLGGDLGRLVVEAGQQGLGLAGTELETGQSAADFVGPASVGAADEAVGIVESERPALPVGEEVDPVDPETQLPQFGFEYFPQCRHGLPGANGMEEFRPRLHTHGGEVAAGREADAGHVVVEAEAVLPPPVRSDAEGVLADLARRRTFGLGGPGPAVLESGQEPPREFGSAREVEGVDSRRQLPEPGLL